MAKLTKKILKENGFVYNNCGGRGGFWYHPVKEKAILENFRLENGQMCRTEEQLISILNE